MKRGFLNRKAKDPKPVIKQATAASTGQDPSENEKDLSLFVNELCQAGGKLVNLDLGRIGVTLPIGKLDTTLPEHYVPKQRQMIVDNGLDIDNFYCEFLYSTIPPNGGMPANGPDTWGECLFKGRKQKQAILSIPNFPKSVPVPPEIRYCIGPSHGFGMFAAKDLVPNDLILAERPLLVIPATVELQIASHPDNSKLTPAQGMQVHLAEIEKLLQVCINRMEPEDRKMFFELHNCHTEDGSGPIFGRVRTNGIEFKIDSPDSETDKDLFRNSGIFPIISRINHSCVPNVSYFFDPPSFSLRLHAIRPIKVGEELVFSYIANIKEPTAKRQENLKPYSFRCACNACTDPNWDVRLSCIVKSCDKPPSGPLEEIVKQSLRWIKIIEDAELESLTEYFNHLTRVVMVSKVLGRQDDVKRYNVKYEAWASAMYGKPMPVV